MNDFAYLTGASQHTYRGDEQTPHPALGMAEVALSALTDAGLEPDDVDLLSCVEPLSWNYEELGAFVAETLKLAPTVEHAWVPAGGTSPQDLLHQIAARIVKGEIHCAVICGGESMRTRRRAARNGEDLQWPERARVNPMRGQDAFTSEFEVRHGLRAPIQVFPLFENAIRAARGRTETEQTGYAAKLLAANAKVAEENPHAWFQDAPSAAAIAEKSANNRLVVYPYTKRMNAIMDVDQFAAIVVTSRAFAKGADAAAILGGTGAEEVWNPVERRAFDVCPAMSQAISTALARAGLAASNIDAMDLYSCFPSAIQFGLQALGCEDNDPRPKTLTGGLAYSGGPGNAYVLHSMAAALTALRVHPEHKLLVTGIGMANTKHTATVLSAASNIPADATGVTTYREPNSEMACTLVEDANGPATVRTYTIEYDRDGQPTNVILILDLADGSRTIANMRDPEAGANALIDRDPIGRRGEVVHDAELQKNFFELNE